MNTMTKKGRIQISKFTKENGDKAHAIENGYICNYPLHIHNGNLIPKIQNGST